MGRSAKPWRRKGRKGWYATIEGKQIPVAADDATERQAVVALAKILEQDTEDRPAEVDVPSVRWVVLRFLDGVRRDKAKLTYQWYARHLESFTAAVGDRRASEIRPYHVTDWLASHAWGPTTRAGAITAVKRAYRWAKMQGYLASNPVADMEKPRAKVREAIPTAEQFRAILDAAKDEAWRSLLTALWETGCRPGEIASVTAAGVDLEAGTWTVVNKTRHRRDATRVVQLTPTMVELSRRLCKAHPTGPIFRNMRGRPWTRNAMACRFNHVRQRHGFGVEATAGAIRHVYITDGLENGVPIATLAELVGHADTKMISKVYSKLGKRSAYLKDAVSQVRPASKPSASPSGRSDRTRAKGDALPGASEGQGASARPASPRRKR